MKQDKESINTNQNSKRRGWRLFHCQECGHHWRWPSRNATSKSGENCPKCSEWNQPYNGEIDLTVPCDDLGNLTVPFDWEGEEPITQPQTEDNPVDVLYNLGQEFSQKSVEDMAGMILILCKRALNDKRFGENLPVAMFLFIKGVLKNREGIEELKELARERLERRI